MVFLTFAPFASKEASIHYPCDTAKNYLGPNYFKFSCLHHKKSKGKGNSELAFPNLNWFARYLWYSDCSFCSINNESLLWEEMSSSIRTCVYVRRCVRGHFEVKSTKDDAPAQNTDLSPQNDNSSIIEWSPETSNHIASRCKVCTPNHHPHHGYCPEAIYICSKFQAGIIDQQTEKNYQNLMYTSNFLGINTNR